MGKKKLPDFRKVMPDVHIGTASDRYAGWIGTVYTAGRWEEKAKTRSRSLGGGCLCCQPCTGFNG